MATGRLIVEEYAGKVGIYRKKYSGVWYTLWNFASPSCLNAFPVVKKNSRLIITVSVIGKSLITLPFCSQLERGCLFLLDQPQRQQLNISVSTHQRTRLENLKEIRQITVAKRTFKNYKFYKRMCGLISIFFISASQHFICR